jgi:L-threonylcarbamoyladenylate synthase
MRTMITNSISQAAAYIKKGDIAAFPTETVYGLGANVYDEAAIKKIFKIKGRPADNPLIVHISKKSDIALLVQEIPETAKKIINKFFPGPITVIFKKNEIIPDAVTAGLDTIAIRMPSSKIARDFIKECGVPVAAPSANLSGSPSPTSFIHVLRDFKGKIPCILTGPKARYGLESTVIDCTPEIPQVLRPGIITLEQLRKIDKRITYKRRTDKIKSPGQRYKHYAPKAKLQITNYLPPAGKLPARSAGGRITNRKDNYGFIGLTPIWDKGLQPLALKQILVCKSLNDYAKNLFSFFRKCDEIGIKLIYAQKVEEKGIGLAIMNRLKKAVG